MQVSVIVSTFNRPGPLHAALGSVAAEDLDGVLETIVVNDGGDSVVSVTRDWQSVMPLRLVELDRRRGPAAARNIGLEHAAGEYIAFLDDDDLFMPGHLASGCRPLEHGDADFVYLGAAVAVRRVNGRPADLAAFPLKAYPYDHRLLMVANFLHTGSVIVRNFRNTPVRFDEALSVCEDWDLWLALTGDPGYRVRFLNEITSVYHRVPEASGLVAGAHLAAPSGFSLARDYIQAKWPAEDPAVVAYRDWMNAFEQFRSDLIARGRRMPNLLFDEILQYLHAAMACDRLADYADISQFFA